jgi:hypothetical protein
MDLVRWTAALLALVSLVACSPTAEMADEIPQYVPPPCDVPGLSQDQYRTCIEHLFCNNFVMRKITLGLRKVDDPRVDEEYRQCLKTGDWDPGPGWLWVVRP